MKLIRFLSIYFLTTFLSLFIISDASALENPVVPNGELGEFRHGTFPSPPIGNFTHVGVDIIAPCGSDIYAFSDGKIKDIIDNTNDKNFNTLGYMVLIEHPASLIGKKFYTLYLHMQMPPEVTIGSQVTGGSTVIGNVGSSGKTLGGCHTHFEIRYFPERFSTWGNIYCPDDQRYSEYFKQNWEDPLTFFRKYPNRHKLVKISGRDNNADKSKLILGRHKHEAGVIEYFNDGTFMLNTDTGEYKKKAGKWTINGDILTLRFYIHPKPYKYKILDLSASTYKIARISVDRNTYNARRTNYSKQSHVYVAKDSRAYHYDRNCSQLTTTDDLIEFSSPQEAENSGAIPCKHCNQLAFDRKDESNQKKQSNSKKNGQGTSSKPPYQPTEVKRGETIPSDTQTKVDSGREEKKNEDDKELLFKNNLADNLKNFVIKADDIPSKFRLDETLQLDNRTQAIEMINDTHRPDDLMYLFNKWGRVDGYRVKFKYVNGVVNEIIDSESSIYKLSDGASKAFSLRTKEILSEESIRKEMEQSGFRLHKFKTMKNPSIGNESIMIYNKISGQYLGVPVTIEMVVIIWRRDEILSSIMFRGYNTSFFDSDVITLAKLQDKRIQQQKEKNSNKKM